MAPGVDHMESNVSRTVLPAEHAQLLAEARPFESDEGPMRYLIRP
jgi:hypothetical protein